jgi:hypothetical protein
MTDNIRGKVARILDTRHLVLNVGSAHGVKAGMYFDVLDPKGEDITDPDTGEILGSIERPKVRVQVIKVDEKLAVASTFKKREINVGGRGSIHMGNIADVFLPPKYVTKYETLKTTEKTWEDLSEAESYVKSGDPVVQVSGEIDVGQNDPS